MEDKCVVSGMTGVAELELIVAPVSSGAYVAVKLGSTVSDTLLLIWEIYCCFNDNSVSLSNCNDADGVMDGSGGDGAIVIEAGKDVVLKTDVDSWVITSLLSLPIPLKYV